jgi:hypothetical protein
MVKLEVVVALPIASRQEAASGRRIAEREVSGLREVRYT